MASYTIDVADTAKLDDLVKAYTAAGGTVDTSTASTDTSSTLTAAATYPSWTYSLPDIQYTPQSLEDLLTEAGNLYNSGYDRQISSAQKNTTDTLEDIGRQYNQSRQEISNAATARGFGRSSYVTDALTKNASDESILRDRYSTALSQSLRDINAERENQISAYASTKKAEQQAKMLELEMFRSELELSLKKAAYEAEVAKYQWDIAHPTGSGISSGGGSSSYGGGSSYSSSGSSGSGSSSSGGTYNASDLLSDATLAHSLNADKYKEALTANQAYHADRGDTSTASSSLPEWVLTNIAYQRATR